ncbi:pantetheine-phosphate adenylyltransferase [Lacticaseibacillus yichunensis]|uniref:Phosphopantetheine adenylyltransferase n=1 Tax=Lacticaseibacillus yichunensis TaxID=2486015 RepID=A0ABW4CSX5_9LACO|nr:pantetheine-phosphate adenylyltransferase [Lacticaseibacillus yichunensis]
MTKIAIFPGSFDPFTNGHLDTVTKASQLFDKVVVAVMTNTNKNAVFSGAEKVAMIEAATAGLANVEVYEQPHMLTVAFAKQSGAQYMVRGVRNTADLNYENDIAAMNQTLASDIQTVLLPADPKWRFLSSSLIREVASFGGDVATLVPANVNAALKAHFGGDRHDPT